MNNTKLGSAGIAAGVVAFLLSTPAFAQVEAEGQVGMGLPGAAPAGTQQAQAAGPSDHDQMVGRFAVGYLGRRTLQVGADGAGGQELAAPVIGVRYWLDRGLGIDLGLGLALENQSQETGPAEAEASAFGLIVHGGVPLALASSQHFVFQVVPEANIGFGSGSVDPDVDLSGFQLDIGARAGAEIHFGFIDIPQLSLQASVGLLFTLQNAKTTVEAPGGDTETTQSATLLRTASFDNPWNIFTSNVAALYYF